LFSELKVYQQRSVVDVPSDWADFVNRHPRSSELLGAKGVEYIRHRPRPASEGDGDPRWDLYSMCESAGFGSWPAIANVTSNVDGCVRDCHREAHEVAARIGMLDMNLLLVDGALAAFAYGYHRRGHITGLQTGAAGSTLAEPIATVLLHMIEDSRRRGDRVIDLGSAGDASIARLRTRTDSTYRITYTPAGSWRPYAVRLSRWAKHHMAKRGAALKK
jgi:hypothetical protein